MRQKYALAENQIADLEDKINTIKHQLDETINEKNDAMRDVDRNQASIDSVQAEKDGLNRTRKMNSFFL